MAGGNGSALPARAAAAIRHRSGNGSEGSPPPGTRPSRVAAPADGAPGPAPRGAGFRHRRAGGEDRAHPDGAGGADDRTPRALWADAAGPQHRSGASRPAAVRLVTCTSARITVLGFQASDIRA